MITTILSGLLPILFVAFLGWLGGRLGLFGPRATTTLASFVIVFALPLALFLAAAHTKPEQLTDPVYGASLFAGLLGAYVLGILLGRLVFRHDMRASVLEGLSCGFPNMAYCGPPVLTAAVGAQGLLAVIVGNLIVTVIMLPLTLMVLQLAAPSNGGENGSKVLLVGRSLLHAVKQPLVWLPVIGAMLAIAGVHLPDLIDNAVEQVGQAAGGVALFILGLMLAQNPVRLGRDVWLNIGLKNLVQPAIILGAALALRLDPTLTKEVFLIGVMPTAIEASVVAERYGAYVHEAAATAAASTFFSIISISLGLSIAAAL